MWVHYALFGILALVGGLLGGRREDGSRKSTAPLLVAWLLFVAMSGLRARTVGNDTSRYYDVFEKITDADGLSEAFAVSRFERGYVVVNYLISRITDDFNVLLLVVSFFSFWSVVLFIHRYARSNPLALLLAFGMSVFYDVMLATRQGIAAAIFLLALPALMERRPVRYLILILLAAQFHASAILLLAAYFIPMLRLNSFLDWVKWGAVIGACTGCLSLVLTKASVFSAYYGHYLSSQYAEGGVRMATVMGVGVRLLMIGLAAMCGWNSAVAADKTGVTRILVTFAVVDAGIMIVSLGFNLLDRLEMYLTLPMVVGLGNVVAREPGLRNWYVSVLLVLIAFVSMTIMLLYRPGWYTLFPYRTVFEEGVW
ncbi:EpsG family protein [Actinomyces succiniciruminis]|uniref:Conserved domain protein n=1 Tax=Actinomyces succiniciruminis TaxID=1522002 RepID=A0A1L7RP50_9ACTO|nr:EpsG family protein [Actinomyces succiniciruminis]CED91442.1 Conserved domain protein [Actinomyces succiniciruminis]